MNNAISSAMHMVESVGINAFDYTWFSFHVYDAPQAVRDKYKTHEFTYLHLPLAHCALMRLYDEGGQKGAIGSGYVTTFDDIGDAINIKIPLFDDHDPTASGFITVTAPKNIGDIGRVKSTITGSVKVESGNLDSLVESACNELRLFLLMSEAGSIQGYSPQLTATGKRQLAKGKKPLIKWSTVTIDLTATRAKSEHKGGTHASPRMHERRGHYATRKSTGKRYWVRPCTVGKAKDGIGYHDYRITT